MTNGEVREMKRKITFFVRRLRGDESGAVIALVAIGIVALIGLGALGLDLGNIAWARERLQATTDMAALSGAAKLSCTSCTSTSVIAAATAYSAVGGSTNKNVQPGLTVSSVSVRLECLTTIGSYNAPTDQCLGAGGPATGSPGCIAAGTGVTGGCNAIEVTQQATVPFTLGQVFGFSTVTLTATSWAAKGGALPPMDIMMVLDNTGSMTNTDPTATGVNACPPSNTRIDCALGGLQTMMAELWPTQDQIGLIVFPPVQYASIAADQTCTSGSISVGNYNAAPSSSSYDIATLTNSFKSTNNSILATPGSSSILVNATCVSGLSVTPPGGPTSSCGTCAGNKIVAYNDPNDRTYLAGAIKEAQTRLLAANPTPSTSGIQNVIIVLSDGGAGNAYGTATTSAATTSGGQTLTFAANALPTVTLVVNSPVSDSAGAIPSGTVVSAIGATTVTLSKKVTRNVAVGDTITFGGYNQCNAAIQAAQTAASNNMWVYSIAYGSVGTYLNTTALSPNSAGCSDIESPAVNSCYTMYKIASDPSKFFSDPMGGTCVSPDNPYATNITTIFTNLGFQFASLIPIGTQ
jgi:Flp pilus assembly protein TadG